MNVTGLILIDLAICAFIMFFLIGQRFNQWPGAQQALLSGKPSDYIDPFRYYAFYLLYVCTFLVVGMAIYNLQLAVPESLKSSKVFEAIVKQLGNQSYTIVALYLLAMVNEKHVEQWDALWRNHLQVWARIPKAVEEVKDNILFSEDSLAPTPERLEDLRKEMKRLQVEAYWEPIIDHWQGEREKASLEWHYLKALYTLRICKRLRVESLHVDDVDRHENRLHDLARVMPKLDPQNEDVKTYAEELNKLYGYFVESLCKHVIKKNPSKNIQCEALQNLGFQLSFQVVSEIKTIGMAFDCLLCLSLICVITIFGYLAIRDWVGMTCGDGACLT